MIATLFSSFMLPPPALLLVERPNEEDRVARRPPLPKGRRGLLTEARESADAP
jgi:hypothetical protein